MSYFDHEDGPVGPPPAVRLYSCGLLSKHGFSDGDELSDILADYIGKECDVLEGFHRARQVVLIALVRERLLPVLDQRVEVFEIGTIHNPIRAETVDGVAVSVFDDNQPALTPVFVDVPGEEVIALARRLIAEKKP